MQADDAVHVPVYSLGQPSRRTGIGMFSMKATMLAGGGLLFFLLLRMAGAGKLSIAVLVVTLLAAALVTISFGGRSLAQQIQLFVQDRVQKYRKENIYIAGPSSHVPGGRAPLPGVLARTELLEAQDGNGRAFGVIFERQVHRATVLMRTQLSGQTAVTQAERNQQTAEWDRWLRGLSLAGDVEAMAFVVATRPGTGDLVAQEVATLMREDSPEVSRQIMLEAGETLSQGVPETDAHIAITFKVRWDGSDTYEFLDQIGTRLPTLYETLVWSGIQAEPMDAAAIVAAAHQFYNPDAESDFEELTVAGIEHGMQWHECGPLWHEKQRDRYHHNGKTSVTWEMAEAPRSTFEDTILASLARPHGRIARKRVCLVYRPYEAGSGTRRVEAEHRDALAAANSSKKVRSASADIRLEHTEAARRAQGKGAQLGRYSLFVTATSDNDDEIKSMRHDVEQAGAQASVRLRVMTGQQDAGFAFTCGLGQVPWGKESTVTMSGV